MTVAFLDCKNLPNLDGLSDAECTARTGKALKFASDQLRMMAHYADVKSKAMIARSSGEIDKALGLEQELEGIYNCMDDGVKW